MKHIIQSLSALFFMTTLHLASMNYHDSYQMPIEEQSIAALYIDEIIKTIKYNQKELEKTVNNIPTICTDGHVLILEALGYPSVKPYNIDHICGAYQGIMYDPKTPWDKALLYLLGCEYGVEFVFHKTILKAIFKNSKHDKHTTILQKTSFNEQGQTFLHIAATLEYNEIILQLLIKKQCDVNSTDCDGNTPLHMALYHEQPDNARVLIYNNANIHAKNNFSITPLHYAAALKNNGVAMMNFLLDYGLKIQHEIETHCSTPLHYAITSGNIENVQWIISKGLNNNHKNEQNKTPLQLCWHLYNETKNTSQRDIALLLVDSNNPVHTSYAHQGTHNKQYATLLIEYPEKSHSTKHKKQCLIQ